MASLTPRDRRLLEEIRALLRALSAAQSLELEDRLAVEKRLERLIKLVPRNTERRVRRVR